MSRRFADPAKMVVVNVIVLVMVVVIVVKMVEVLKEVKNCSVVVRRTKLVDAYCVNVVVET